MTSPPSWEDPRGVLKRHGLKPRRQWSQNFLVNREAVERIAATCRLPPGQTVVEYGPGVGTLTAALLRAGLRVTAIERDPSMITLLNHEFSQWINSAILSVVPGDAATVDLTELCATRSEPLTVVGNLPYAITGAILRNLGLHRTVLRRAVVMVQREVRDRLTAKPATKAYGGLTVFVQASFTVASEFILRPGSFFPAPTVASAVVSLEPRANPVHETNAFRTVVRAAFDRRRKTLRNALSASFDEEVVRESLVRANIDPTRRGETLALEEFAALSAAVESVNGSQS